MYINHSFKVKKIGIILLLLSFVHLSYSQEKTGIKWWNPTQSETPVISGQGWPNQSESLYHRIPSRAEKDVRKEVWRLSKQSAGLSIRFWTNSDSIHVNYNVKGAISMAHMPATGVSGLDLYSKTSDGDPLRFWGSYSIASKSAYVFNIGDKSDSYRKHGREYQLFLPLYNEVDSLEIGVPEGAIFKIIGPRKEKPIVVYGTSITQGACASRPGMAWTNILERRIERPVYNLGFSGNGRLEPEIIDLMTEIDAKVYVLDCLPNLNPDKFDIVQLTIDAVKKLKEKRPNVPVILTDHIGYADDFVNKNSDLAAKINIESAKAFQKLVAEGYTNIYLLSKEKLNFNFDHYVDNIHANDVGMVAYADAFEALLRSIMNENVGELSTTIPKTQSRDIAVYNWEERHQEILALNKTNPPEIALFGNSIVNFWGGDPKTRIVSGQDSWDKIMRPLGVRNFGFGWDRIENVLWRVHHDELDGFDAEKIVLMIGTNNIGISTDDEIISGFEELIKAIRIRQPNSNILLIGILPRFGKEAEVNALNYRISKLAGSDNVSYHTIGDSLLSKSGKIDQSLFTDGLHPNEKGYRIMANSMQKILKGK